MVFKIFSRHISWGPELSYVKGAHLPSGKLAIWPVRHCLRASNTAIRWKVQYVSEVQMNFRKIRPEVLSVRKTYAIPFGKNASRDPKNPHETTLVVLSSEKQ
ncbi:hypothetical protein AVEN_54517-1 [Araneus ventricosus]|uniref:Uncharacterized protein n=1 Tax=Araneus ventricosus TaxID=182803 RepID=A0A4Y2EHX9_ARAVE|nr:hypothetical protein AVEN_54517-1 [Araneus ventricosus]